MNKKYTWLRRLPVLLGIGFTLLIVVAVFLLKDLFHKPPHTKKVVQQLSLIHISSPRD